MKRTWSKLTAAVLGLILCVGAAAAAVSGSLSVTITDDADAPVAGMSVLLYRVGETDGTLTAEFADCGLTADALLSESSKANSALALADWVKEHQIAGAEKITDEKGAVLFSELPLGIYLVVGKGEGEMGFRPFLLSIPTVINGEADYDVEATPKVDGGGDDSDDPDDPNDPDDPVGPDDPIDPDDPDDPDLPQTGVNAWPKYLLLVLGALLMLVGVAEILRGRRKSHE